MGRMVVFLCGLVGFMCAVVGSAHAGDSRAISIILRSSKIDSTLVKRLERYLYLRGYKVRYGLRRLAPLQIFLRSGGLLAIERPPFRNVYQLPARLKDVGAKASAILMFFDQFLDALPKPKPPSKAVKSPKKLPPKPRAVAKKTPRARLRKAPRFSVKKSLLKLASKPGLKKRAHPPTRLSQQEPSPPPRRPKVHPYDPNEVPVTGDLVTFSNELSPQKKDLYQGPWCEFGSGPVWTFEPGVAMVGISVMFGLRLKHWSFQMEFETQGGQLLELREPLAFVRPSILVGWLPFSDWEALGQRWTFRLLMGFSPFFLGFLDRQDKLIWQTYLGANVGLQMDWHFQSRWSLFLRPVLFVNFEPRNDRVDLSFQFSARIGVMHKF